MTTTGLIHQHKQTTSRRTFESGKYRQLFLACGFLAPLVYLAADVFGGLRYEGYSFTSQAVSELMATGSPSETFVDPLFLAYDALLLAFGLGLLLEAGRTNRPLRIAAAFLILQAVLGFLGPTRFEMHPRGTEGLAGDMPHIVLTVALVLSLLVAIGFGAFALGKRFRIYSFATLATIIIFGVATAPYGSKLAAGQPTPGFGILERINIYASIVWIAVLGIALLRRPLQRNAGILP